MTTLIFFLGQCLYLRKHANSAYYSQQHWYVFPKNLAGFEPGPSGPEADAMSTAPRRHPVANE
jgi:hypothetical protein